MRPLKCGWCGQTVEVSTHQKARPHRNGAQQCPGSGMHRDYHDRLNEAKPADTLVPRTHKGKK